MNTTSYSRGIYRARQILSISIALLVTSLLSSGCESPTSAASDTSVAVEIPTSALSIQGGMRVLDGLPFNGVSLDYSPNGGLARKTTFVNGKKEGLSQQWFENGQLSFSCQYHQGKRHGTVRSWWRNGQLRSVARLVHGVAEGRQESWYASGNKFRVINLVNGQESGLQQSWRENGKLYNNYEARNGRIYGLKRANLCYALEDEEVQYRD